MKKPVFILIVLFTIVTSCKDNKNPRIEEVKEPVSKKLPNIIFIYADDLGYGDLRSYGAQDIATPNFDNLANNGIKFTNGYATSATCSPSRFALLTGTYPWRNKNAKILPGTAPLLIDTAQVTLPKILKNQGYQTGIVGKWHLGLGTGNVDWNTQISPGPNEVGFDYSYIMAATQDRVPTVYIEDGYVDNLEPNDPILVDYDKNFEGEPTGTGNPELLKFKGDLQHSEAIVNGISRIGYMKGGKSARWVDEDMADHFLEKAQSFVKKHKNEPFFLYYALQQPHVPRTPNPRFVGASGMGPRGDVIIEADWCVGEFVKTLELVGLLENTLIIVSSDNGPVLDDGYVDQAIEKLGNHKPWGTLRGGKYSLFEAGTRVPFITYWKGKINPGVSDAIISQVDLLSSMAQLAGSNVTTTDSENMLDLLLGKTSEGRKNLIIEATSRTAFRQGDWVMIPPYKGPKLLLNKGIETGNLDTFQLYNLKEDPHQDQNLAASNPNKLNEMIETFEAIRGGSYHDIEQPDFK
ncbi:arylsulfatase [Litoribaculum gwangyangense]|uniref:Sulfatase-like hydrolase/transferase n=1 Tax=Litoribaculum gwangyangense TaxID=1130722 RepID=A0ABP9CKY8_9FLAO